MTIKYEPRWKEMLDGFVGHHKFTVEITMGVVHVYFPTESTWDEKAPEWAKGLWASARDGAVEWCKNNSVPFDIDQAAWVDFESDQVRKDVPSDHSESPSFQA